MRRWPPTWWWTPAGGAPARPAPGGGPAPGTPPGERRLGALVPIEGERWLVTLGGWLGDHAPADEVGFLAFARSLPAPDIYDVIAGAEPLGEPALHKFPASLRRRYERLRRGGGGGLGLRGPRGGVYPPSPP